MGDEIVTVVAGGRQWTAFKKVEVEAAINEAARSFSLTIAAEQVPEDAQSAFFSGNLIEIFLGGDLACAGYVDRYKPKISQHSTAEIEVSGRSKSQDLIDGSAVHKTGRFENKDPAEIMKELDKAGVGVRADVKLTKVPWYQITPGETVFRIGEKLARAQGVTLSGQPDGSILLTKCTGKRHAGGLIHPGNIKEGEADHNWAGRHSEVIVRGQRPIDHGADNLEIEQKAKDSAVKRYRPVVVVQDEDTDKQRAKKRAGNRRDKEAGNALKANIKVQGFRDDGGKLWTPGFLVWTQSRFLALQQDMCIEKATFRQERPGGSVTELALTDPRAHGGKSKGGSSGGEWDTDAGEDD